MDNEIFYDGDTLATKDIIVETSPCSQYIRFNEEIGRGSSKIIYKAIDVFNMKEVVWNSISITPSMKCEEKKRIVTEINLLKTIKHENVLKIYNSWYNKDKKEVVFITEYMIGGSLNDFIQKYKHFKPKHIQNWCIQILKGLEYLHENQIIHGDIKLENIFICGETSQICIGDFGLSINKSQTNTKSCLGTPEMMAPEIYSGEYDESIDIYAFGMCLLEMYTMEKPYYECNNICQIYKRVTNGILPLSIEKVYNLEIKNLIIQLLGDKTKRPTAKDLLTHNLFIQNKVNILDCKNLTKDIISLHVLYKNINYILTINVKDIKIDNISDEDCKNQIIEFIQNKIIFNEIF
jgi:WNK lysine deficient protein kinase